MKKLVVLLFLIVSSYTLFGQMAKFCADTTLLRSYTGNQNEFEKAMEMQWLINGKSLSFGSDTVKILPDKTTMDTIFFRRNTNTKWDTILCNIALPYTYNFTLNVCCGAFDVQRDKKRIPLKAEFTIKGDTKKMFLGRLEETAKFMVGEDKKTITPLCRSVMKSHIYWVMLQEIYRCNDEGNCERNEEFCIQTENGEPYYDFSYKVVKTITKFLYMPLTDKPLRITYKPEKNKLKIK